MEYLLERIREIVFPVLESAQVDLVELKIERRNGRMFLKFFVDKPEGGITLDECANLNNELGQVLDEAALIQESFILEVSSPGLDRALLTVKDFKRVMNRNIRLFLSEAIENRLEFEGKLKSVEDDRIIISWQDKEIIVPLNKINKAKQII